MKECYNIKDIKIKKKKIIIIDKNRNPLILKDKTNLRFPNDQMRN